MSVRTIWGSLIVCLLCTQTAHANVQVLPRSPQELTSQLESQGEAHEKTLAHVASPRLVYLNKAALFRDFPIPLVGFSEQELSQWVLRNYNLVSRDLIKQLKESGHEVELQEERQDITSYVAPESQSAVVDVVEFEEANRIGMMALEGAIDSPISLAQNLVNTSRQLAMQKLFDVYNIKNGTSLETAETYFILELPIKFKSSSGEWMQLSIRARQPQVGTNNHFWGNEFIPYMDKNGFRSGDFGALTHFTGVAILHPHLRDTFAPPETSSDWTPENIPAWHYSKEFAHWFSATPEATVQDTHQHFAEMLAPVDEEWTPLKKDRVKIPRHSFRQQIRAYVRRALQSPSEAERYRALQLVNKYKLKRLLPKVAPLIHDNHPSIRQLAIQSFSIGTSTSAIIMFRTILQNTTEALDESAALALAFVTASQLPPPQRRGLERKLIRLHPELRSHPYYEPLFRGTTPWPLQKCEDTLLNPGRVAAE